MSTYETLEGTPGLSIDDVAHVMLPGRGRDATGKNISEQGISRVIVGAEIFIEQGLEQRDGVIVCSGYKTPSDTNGGDWSPKDSTERFIGRPEADSMRAALLVRAVPDSVIRVERHSIDTVTNFTLTEAGNFFGRGDERPVAIVAQEQHLERINKVARKTLKRDYIGVVAPEVGEVDHDSLAARVATQVILLGINRYTSAEKAAMRTNWIAEHVWGLVLKASALRPSAPAYKTDADKSL